jgi:hypothetical protein
VFTITFMPAIEVDTIADYELVKSNKLI